MVWCISILICVLHFYHCTYNFFDELVKSILFIYEFMDFPVLPLLLDSIFIPSCLKKALCTLSIFINLLRIIIWLKYGQFYRMFSMYFRIMCILLCLMEYYVHFSMWFIRLVKSSTSVLCSYFIMFEMLVTKVSIIIHMSILSFLIHIFCVLSFDVCLQLWLFNETYYPCMMSLIVSSENSYLKTSCVILV